RGRYQNPANWRQATTIARGATLGAGAVVLPGLRVGEFALVGAGAVVTRDVPPHQLVVGNPARPAGWVCTCAGQLDGTLICRLCRKAFRFTDDSVTPVA